MDRNNTATLLTGDCLELLAGIPDNSIDAIATDPPYGLSNVSTKKVLETLTHWVGGDRAYIPEGAGMMNQSWDAFVPPPAVWDEVHRVLKPGAFLVSFSGARMYDWMGMAIRIAGLNIADGLGWARTGGMMKTGDLGKLMAKAGLEGAEDWHGFSTSLKPSLEPMVLARKPVKGSAIRSVAKWGVGGLNIDATRVPHASAADRAESVGKNQHGDYGTPQEGSTVATYGDFSMLAPRENYDPGEGRIPSNLLLDSGLAAQLDEQSGISKSRKGGPRRGKPGEGWATTHTGSEYEDIGGASRFFHKFDEHQALLTTSDAAAIVDETDPFEFIAAKLANLQTRVYYAPRAATSERPSYVDKNGEPVRHSTVKPIALMRWVCRLICPPGGTILDPFAGSGTTLEAAMLEQFSVIGIEREQKFWPLIRQRLQRVEAAE